MVFYPDVLLSESERLSLATWISANATQPFFQKVNMGGKRVTTRFSDKSMVAYPDLVREVRSRIAQTLGFPLEPLPAFADGAVASCAYPGDTCFAHVDPRWHEGLFTVHCNVVVSAPEAGGQLLVDGQPYKMPEGKFICYPVSEMRHETLKVTGNKARLLWVFGFCVSSQQYEDTLRTLQ